MTLQTELATDPLGRGYAAMTTAQTLASLQAINRPIVKPTITGSDLFECTDQAEWLALTANQKTVYTMLVNMNSPLSTAVGSKTRETILSMFPNGNTFNSLVALVSAQVSRAEELGLSLDWGVVNSARAALGLAV